MSEIETYLKLPLGTSLAEGNWENHVYELGNDWVYKEIKSPESLDPATENYTDRKLLQEFWNSDVHFQNMQRDYEVFKSELGSLIPKTLFCKHQSLLSELPSAIISIQEKLNGNLLKDIKSPVSGLCDLAKTVRELCENVFQAPADFHDGNLILMNSKEIYFFDTGTPSDWEYFLDANKFAQATNASSEEATSLVNFMKPIHELHWKKLIVFSK